MGASYTVRITSFNSHTYLLTSTQTADSQGKIITGAINGVYAWDITTPTAPTYAGIVFNFNQEDFELHNNLLYALENDGVSSTARNQVKIYDITTLTAPSLLGTYTAPITTGYSGGNNNYIKFKSSALNAAATRLYVAYLCKPLNGTGNRQNAPSGWVVFDVSNTAAPALVTSPSQVDGSGNLFGNVIPIPGTTGWLYFENFIKLSPDETKIALSFNTMGVAIWSLSGDTATLGSQIATTGETKDGFVDASNNAYIPSGDDIQVYDLNNKTLNVIPNYAGGFVPFKDSRYITIQGLYSTSAGVLDFTLGAANFVYTASITHSQKFEGLRYDSASNTLYAGTSSGLFWFTVGAAPTYTLTQVNSILSGTAEIDGVSLPFTAPNGNVYVAAIALAKGHNYIIQVTGSGSPQIVMDDPAAFTKTTTWGTHGTNGPFANVEVVGNYIYFGDHRSGVQIYQINSDSTFTYKGLLSFNATWVEAVGTSLLLINSYHGSGGQPTDGLYIADLRTNPVTPTILTNAVTPIGNPGPGWRSKYYVPNIWQGGLGGGTLWQLNGGPF